MSLGLIAMFVDEARRHGIIAKTQKDGVLRAIATDLFEISIANALCCRDLHPETRRQVVLIRHEFRKDIERNV